MTLRPRSDVAAALVLAALLLPGCGSKRQGVPYSCECEYLTDFDDAAKRSARLCAEDPEDALVVGKGCVQLLAPAPIQTCTCAREEGPACKRGCLE